MVQSVYLLGSIESKLKAIKGTGLLIGYEQQNDVYIVGLAHLTKDNIEEALSQLPASLSLPLKIVGTAGSDGLTLEFKPTTPSTPVVHATVTNTSTTFTVSLNQGTPEPCTPTILPENPLQRDFITIRCPIDVVLQYYYGTTTSIEDSIQALQQQLCGDDTVYVLSNSNNSSGGGGSSSILLQSSSSSGSAASQQQQQLASLMPKSTSNTTDWLPALTAMPLTNSAAGATNNYTTPTVSFTQEDSKIQCIQLHLEALTYCPKTATQTQTVTAIKTAITAQLTNIQHTLSSNPQDPSPQRTLCFLPPTLTHHILLTYPLSLPLVEAEEERLLPLRTRLHTLLGLPVDRPLLRVANALPSVTASIDPATNTFTTTRFTTGTGTTGGSNNSSGATRLADVHKSLSSSGIKDGSLHLVNGTYDYYHYMQDKMDDSGWGCAYRSLQTICSWFSKQHYTARQPPTHREIQSTLVALGDKPSSFIGSRQWIGAIELGFVLDSLLGVSSKVITVASGSEMSSKAREIAQHFDTQGTPIMIGGGVLAYTLLGIEFNESTGECAFLILDPHYTGNDDVGKVKAGQWVAWKRFGDKAAAGGELFVADAFYNLLCPQRPSTV